MNDSEKTNLLLACLSVQLDILIQVSCLTSDDKHLEAETIKTMRDSVAADVIGIMKDE